MAAYYNEIDPFAAAWLRELINAGHIAPGEVDERSIADVAATDLVGFSQCHFFAGIGVWSYALRCAGWPDDRQVWTGSCPCQPFSSAGKGKGFKDERHLWPEFYRLISQCRPATCFGEQVASKDGLAWVELVQDNMEGAGYAFGAVDTCAAGFGAPHIRQRLYWVADAIGSGQQGQGWCSSAQEQRVAECGLSVYWVADAHDQRRECQPYQQPTRIQPAGIITPEQRNELSDSSASVCLRVANPDNAGRQLLTHAEPAGICGKAPCQSKRLQQPSADSSGFRAQRPGPTNGFWRNSDWLLCKDGKWRAVESGTSPLAHGAAARVGRLRGYGNAIVAQQAQAFIKAFMEIKEHQPCQN